VIEVKMLELRDKGTFIPVIALRVREEGSGTQEGWLIRKSGWARFQSGYYLFNSGDSGKHFAISLGDPEFLHTQTFPVDRTYTVAFTYIASHWNEFSSGDVVDVQYILGETDSPKISERYLEV
jgi:hypothetical protein